MPFSGDNIVALPEFIHYCHQSIFSTKFIKDTEPNIPRTSLVVSRDSRLKRGSWNRQNPTNAAIAEKNNLIIVLRRNDVNDILPHILNLFDCRRTSLFSCLFLVDYCAKNATAWSQDCIRFAMNNTPAIAPQEEHSEYDPFRFTTRQAFIYGNL
jgi:hypothetical protein